MADLTRQQLVSIFTGNGSTVGQSESHADALLAFMSCRFGVIENWAVPEFLIVDGERVVARCHNRDDAYMVAESLNTESEA